MYNSKAIHRNEKILELCSNKVVLDVGAIGQDNYFDDVDWLHEKILKVALSVTGVDIIQIEIHKLNALGYTFYDFNELKNINLKYDIIIMADVIEHIENPKDFLNQYAQFLIDEGSIILTTPNSNRARNFLSILFFNNYGLNSEHTFWFCPRTMSELINRTNLRIQDFYWLKESNRFCRFRKLKIILLIIEKILAYFRSNFNPSFMIILKKVD